jgi:hypothetical protein
LLARYPCLPAGHYRLSRTASGDTAAENQALLDDALAAQREELRRQLAAFLADPDRCKQLKRSWRMILSPGDADWLLRVINDIHVGSWIRLGSPDFEAGVEVEMNAETIPQVWALETSGSFEYVLIRALTHG